MIKPLLTILFALCVYTATFAYTIEPGGNKAVVKDKVKDDKTEQQPPRLQSGDQLASNLGGPSYDTKLRNALGTNGYNAFKYLLFLDILNSVGPSNIREPAIDVEQQVANLEGALKQSSAIQAFGSNGMGEACNKITDFL